MGDGAAAAVVVLAAIASSRGFLGFLWGVIALFDVDLVRARCLFEKVMGVWHKGK